MYQSMIKNNPQLMRTVPYKHQLDALHACDGQEYYAYFMEMGTGKTKVALDEIALLHHSGHVQGAIILAPNGVKVNWTKDQIPLHLSDHIRRRVFVWDSGAKTKEREQFAKIETVVDGTLDILVMNIEALSMGRGAECAMSFAQRRKGRVITIIDESTTIKNHKALRTKAVFKLGAISRYRRIMTGSPVTQSPLDLFGQCLFLHRSSLGHTSYFSFRATYAEMQIMRFGPRSFPKIVGYRNIEQLKRTIARFSFRVTKEECLDLPEKIHERRYLTLSDEQVAAYDKLRNEALMVFESGDVLSITSALTMFSKLHSILCGHVRDDNGKVHDIPHNRVRTLMETIEEIDGKVIIWCNFQRDVEQIIAALREEYGDASAVSYYGPDPNAKREIAIESFRACPTCRFFVATLQCGGYGLNLQHSHNVIYYSNSFSLAHRLQSEDRAHRSGQRENVVYVDLIVPGTLDEKVVEALANKKNLADMVMTNWKDLLT